MVPGTACHNNPVRSPPRAPLSEHAFIPPENLPEKHAGIQEGNPFVTHSFATDKKHGNVSKKTP